MSYLMGVDLGTSSVRTMIMDDDGGIKAVCKEDYEISIPQIGYAEQDPKEWYEKFVLTLKRCLSEGGIEGSDIKAVSFSGQMHGLVCLDEQGECVCPAIIWPDQRTGKVIRNMYEKLGRGFIAGQTQNTVSTGFLIASLCWIFEERRDLYERIRYVMLPKDYIKFRLTGSVITDYSDAAGSLAFNNEKMAWAYEMIDKLGLDRSIFPPCEKSTYIVGHVTERAAKETGLGQRVKVVNGGSDQCMQSIGNGITTPGVFAANIGTAGQISTIGPKPYYDEKLRTNTFAHVIDGHWNIMGACLTSGVSLKWLKNQIIGEGDYQAINREGEKIPPGCEGVLYLPYLSGERTPHQDSEAKALFSGLTLKHNKYYMARAVMEGVAYSLKDCMAVVEGTGLKCHKIIAAGGGANSPLWLQIQADILEQDICRSTASEQACMGAAMTAGVAVGIYSSFSQACSQLVRLDSRVYHPIERNVKIYRDYYPIFRELYTSNKMIFKEIDGANRRAEELLRKQVLD